MPYFSELQLNLLDKGKVVRADNGKRYAVCQDCKKLICLDKLFGDFHFCSPQ